MTFTSLMRILFWLFPLSLLATVNEPLRVSLFSGYRNDTLHFHLQEGGTGILTYSEIYKDVQFWENGIDLRAIHRDLCFVIRGSYAAFGKGRMTERYADLSFTQDNPTFHFDTDGWAADGSGYFSYAVNLTQDRRYKVILLPLVGFSGHFERLNSKNGRPDPWVGNSYTMQSSIPSELHTTWYGAFIGAAFTIDPGQGLFFHAGYSYHFLNERFKSSYKETISFTDPIKEVEKSISFHSKGNGNIGQSGWGQFEYSLYPWRIGLGTSIHYFSSTELPVSVKIENEPSDSTHTISQKLKVRWTPISGWFIVTREI